MDLAKGHGHFVEDEEGNLWVVFHGYENGYMNRGRKLLLSPVEVTADGWFQVPEEEEEGDWSQEIAVCDPRSWQRLRGSAWSDLSMEDECMRWKGSEEAGNAAERERTEEPPVNAARLFSTQGITAMNFLPG